MDNKLNIKKHNEQFEQNLVSFKLNVNQYTDLVRNKYQNVS